MMKTVAKFPFFHLLYSVHAFTFASKVDKGAVAMLGGALKCVCVSNREKKVDEKICTIVKVERKKH